MFATPTYRTGLFALALSAAVLLPAAGGAAQPKFKSPEEALKQGIGAFQGGFYELALPALEASAAHNLFLGQYYLARLYADNSGAHTDHAKAYMLYQRIADEYIDADPDDDSRAPFVAKALTALAGYVREGLPEVGLKPNPARATDYLRYSATFFNDEDAQFELARLYLYGEPSEIDASQGKHWLSTLAQKGHAGGQAFLALELWRGKIMEKDPVRALTLVALAAENAQPGDRVWIDDIYQNIYCGSGASTRKQVGGLVADWRNRYGRKPDVRDRSGLAGLSADAVRTCQDGEQVVTFDAPARAASGQAGAVDKLPPPPAASQPFLRGNSTGSGLAISTPGPAGDPQER